MVISGCLCIWSTVAHAQAPDASSVIANLRSGNPHDVAWAAFDAGALHIKEAVPAMIAVLDAPPSASDEERRALIGTLLDALVQIGSVPWRNESAFVPASTLAPYFDRYPVQTLVLLQRLGPERDQLLMDHFKSIRGGDMWFAVANLLLVRPPAGFASTVLKQLKLHLTIVVSDGGNIGQGSAHGGGGIADGIGQRPKDFPPYAFYRFEDAASGASVLSTGPRTVYYSRTLFTDWQYPTATPIGGGPYDQDRLDYVAAILGRFERLALRAQTSVSIRWRNERDYALKVANARQDIQLIYAEVLNRLVAEHHLTDEERRSLPIQLTIEVNDQRTNRTEPLPSLD